jgi:hypothetical protein
LDPLIHAWEIITGIGEGQRGYDPLGIGGLLDEI